MLTKQTRITVWAALAAVFLGTYALKAAPVGTAFTYQSRLMDGGSPANGTYDLKFSLWLTAGGPLGMIAGPICRDHVDVVDGLFTVEVDFGDQFNGDARYLEISVRAYDAQFDCTNGSFTTLTPRQALRAAPYAMRALSAPNPSALDAPGGEPNVVSVNAAADVSINGKVGIGTASPVGKLHIDESTNSPLIIAIDSGATSPQFSLFSFQDQGTTQWFLGKDVFNDFSLSTPSARVLTADATTRNVGIGTFTPLAALHVDPTSGVIIGGNPNSGGYTALRMDLSAASGGNARIQAIESSGSAWGDLILNPAAGNVGIGIDAPSARLTVAGTIQSTSGGFKFPDGSTQMAASVSYWNPNGADIYNNNGGKVGVGTATPTADLHVVGDSVFNTASVESANTNGTWLHLKNTGGGRDWHFVSTGTGNGEGAGKLLLRGDASIRMTLDGSTGRVGIGTTAPDASLHIAGGVRARGGAPGGFGVNDNGYAFSGNGGDDDSGMFSSANGQLEFYTDATEKVRITPSGDVGIGISTPYGKLHVNGTAVLSNTVTNSIQILGGGDIAEPFDVQSSETIEPGMVVSIDPDNPGKLRLARSAYDRTVAGIISGAGGVQPGMTLQQKGSIADGEHPVALTGRVYCHVDADANGPVKPGDLLTTSSTPGHAMKVSDHAQAGGAILGKAMTSLSSGKGLVLVLVSLQ